MKYILSILLLVLFSSCKGQPNSACLVKLEKELMPVLNKEEIQGEIINIKDNINCIEWDEVLIVMAISSKKNIEQDAKIKIPYQYESSFFNLYGDSDAMLFFLKNKIAVNHIFIKGTCRRDQTCKTYDFLNLIGSKNFAITQKKDAIFEVYTQDVKDNQGNSWKRENAIRIKM